MTCLWHGLQDGPHEDLLDQEKNFPKKCREVAETQRFRRRTDEVGTVNMRGTAIDVLLSDGAPA